MILRLWPGTMEDRVSAIVELMEKSGLRTSRSPEPARPIIAVLDACPEELAERLRAMAEVESIEHPLGAWRRVDRSFRDCPSQISVGGVAVGRGSVVVIAGPCSVENEDQMRSAARCARRAGAHILRGGAFKPRTSPYAFQGLGREGLYLLKQAGLAEAMPIVSEIMDAAQLPDFLDHDVDCLQIGARNMQNFTLLKKVASARRPVLLKRGLSATISEWLQSAEYLAAHGCDDVILCERGIRTFEPATRNTLDLTVLPLLQQWSHLPILVDPSHAAGIPGLIPPLARAALAAGADGLAVEVHPRPEVAKSDGNQALLPGELAGLVADARVYAAVGGRHLARQNQFPVPAQNS
ncbi:MAG TPA: 3-deoxy-7-phosphoheptulonate synthase [Planctomycetes bacterium]|nr:3-deoxy-7-phosphoheptulonate synthase [Planctomycetota bacterium]HIL50661.1 3-deoxy-7-phosphoheptulonate synthase [Planctomycetota bacterium]